MSRKAFHATVNIDAPPEQVFAVLCDVERWPEWTPTVSAAQRLDRGPFKLGRSARKLKERSESAAPTGWRSAGL
jgi:uncharacterized protein YndB with AHSA1/START domain